MTLLLHTHPPTNEKKDDVPTYPYVDYSEKRSLPISVPQYKYVDIEGERFVVSFCSY